MDLNIFIAFLAAVINMILSLIVPSLLKNNNYPLLTNIKTIYETHKQLIITSSIIVGVTTYIALMSGDKINENYSWFNNDDNTEQNEISFINLSNLNNYNNHRTPNKITQVIQEMLQSTDNSDYVDYSRYR